MHTETNTPVVETQEHVLDAIERISAEVGFPLEVSCRKNTGGEFEGQFTLKATIQAVGLECPIVKNIDDLYALISGFLERLSHAAGKTRHLLLESRDQIDSNLEADRALQLGKTLSEALADIPPTTKTFTPEQMLFRRRLFQVKYATSHQRGEIVYAVDDADFDLEAMYYPTFSEPSVELTEDTLHNLHMSWNWSASGIDARGPINAQCAEKLRAFADKVLEAATRIELLPEIPLNMSPMVYMAVDQNEEIVNIDYDARDILSEIYEQEHGPETDFTFEYLPLTLFSRQGMRYIDQLEDEGLPADIWCHRLAGLFEVYDTKDNEYLYRTPHRRAVEFALAVEETGRLTVLASDEKTPADVLAELRAMTQEQARAKFPEYEWGPVGAS